MEEKFKKILEKGIQKNGFVGGDSEDHVHRTLPESETEDFEEGLELDDAMDDWRSYMMACCEIDVETQDPFQMKEQVLKEIEEFRIDIGKIKNDLASKLISWEDAQKEYAEIIGYIEGKGYVITQIEDYLAVARYGPWRNRYNDK